jgi:restriction system protein
MRQTFSSAINDDAQILPLFVGREIELRVLGQELLGRAPRIVCISGPAGIGKTSLAMMFAQMNRQAFPAGVYNIHATPVEPLDRTAARDVPRKTKPYLIIANDVEILPEPLIDAQLGAMRQRHPNAHVILTSRFPRVSGHVAMQLNLAGLSQDEFRSLIEKRLAFAGEPEEAQALFAALAGHPLATTIAARLMETERLTPRELLQRLQDFTYPGMIDETGAEIREDAPDHDQMITDIVSVSDEFLQKLHDNPKLIYELSPRGFEELVAELLGRLEYEVTLTPASKDGGKDIYAAKKDHLGTFLYIVECKKYAPDRPIGVALVRQLNGVVQAEQATAGILATTSSFTRGAKEFQKTIAFQISLKDYFGIQEWLNAVLKK